MVPIMTFMAFDAIEILAGAGTLARYGKKEARVVSRIFLRSRQDFTTASQGPRDKKRARLDMARARPKDPADHARKVSGHKDRWPEQQAPATSPSPSRT